MLYWLIKTVYYVYYYCEHHVNEVQSFYFWEHKKIQENVRWGEKYKVKYINKYTGDSYLSDAFNKIFHGIHKLIEEK